MNSTHHIPKAEIHVHLEATISPDLCRKFATRNNVEISEDLFGSQINKASRIMSISHAGQVLVSQAVWESASNFLKEINNQEIKYSKFVGPYRPTL